MINQNDTNNGQRIAASPANEPAPQTLEGVSRAVKDVAGQIEGSSKIPALEQSSEDKMKALYDYDKSIESGYQSPVAESAKEMYGSDYFSSPAGDITSASKSAVGQAGGVSDIFSTIASFKSFESSALTSAMNTIFKFFESQESRKAKLEDRAWEKEKFEREMALKKSAATGATTAGETRNRTVDSATKDARGGLNAEDFSRKYGGQLEDWELIKIYNENSPHGSMEERPEQFKKWAGGDEGASSGPIDIKVVDEDFNSFRAQDDTGTPEENQITKEKTLMFVETNDPDNYDKVKSYLDLKYPNPVPTQAKGTSRFLQDLLKTRVY